MSGGPKPIAERSNPMRGLNNVRDRMSALEREMKALSLRVDGLETAAGLAASNTQEILDFLKHAKSLSGYARKWGPRVATFLVGVAIARGWISAENGQNFLHVFGF